MENDREKYFNDEIQSLKDINSALKASLDMMTKDKDYQKEHNQKLKEEIERLNITLTRQKKQIDESEMNINLKDTNFKSKQEQLTQKIIEKDNENQNLFKKIDELKMEID